MGKAELTAKIESLYVDDYNKVIKLVNMLTEKTEIKRLRNTL